jgi:putative restriction endonuclease
MGFGVFIHRSDSIYDDSPAERYQFPAQYLRRVEACVGDWIVYYEPQKVIGTRGYFGVAKVRQVIADPAIAGMYVAVIEPGSYLDFVNPVPFTGPSGIAEKGLLNTKGKISGRAQSAVRPLSAEDFDRIVGQGLADAEPLLPRVDMNNSPLGLYEENSPFLFERERARSLTSRTIRDRVFRRIILRAYENRCAVTGIRLINGGGRAEATAAHIQPVEANGPDIAGNGIALSGTAHWMFDRGLISLADDLQILISRQANDPEAIRALVNKDGLALRPKRMSDRPHPHFLHWHREYCFKH